MNRSESTPSPTQKASQAELAFRLRNRRLQVRALLGVPQTPPVRVDARERAILLGLLCIPWR